MLPPYWIMNAWERSMVLRSPYPKVKVEQMEELWKKEAVDGEDKERGDRNQGWTRANRRIFIEWNELLCCAEMVIQKSVALLLGLGRMRWSHESSSFLSDSVLQLQTTVFLGFGLGLEHIKSCKYRQYQWFVDIWLQKLHRLCTLSVDWCMLDKNSLFKYIHIKWMNFLWEKLNYCTVFNALLDYWLHIWLNCSKISYFGWLSLFIWHIFIDWTPPPTAFIICTDLYHINHLYHISL